MPTGRADSTAENNENGVQLASSLGESLDSLLRRHSDVNKIKIVRAKIEKAGLSDEDLHIFMLDEVRRKASARQ
jgi:hypothetical protein